MFTDYLSICLLILSLGVLAVAIYYILTKFSAKIPRSKLTVFINKQWRETFWKRIIIMYFINYTFTCNKAMHFINNGDTGFPLYFYISQLFQLIPISVFLLHNFNRLNEPSFRDKYGQLYLDITFRRRKAI